MAFVLKRKTVTLTFDEGELAGLEVVCDASVSVETMLFFQRLATNVDVAGAAEAFHRFGDEILMEWNLEIEGLGAIAPTGDGFLSLPMAICMEILNRWGEAIGGVAAPLGAPSSNGKRSAASRAKTAR